MSKHTSHIVTDLSWGCSGKDEVIFWLLDKYRDNIVIRCNGGPQSRFFEETFNPESTNIPQFSQYSTAILYPETDTFISDSVLVSLSILEKEAKLLSKIGVIDPWKRLIIHKDCNIISRYHMLTEKISVCFSNQMKKGIGLGINGCIDGWYADPDTSITISDLLDDSNVFKNKVKSYTDIILPFISKLAESGDIRAGIYCKKLKEVTTDSFIEATFENYVSILKNYRVEDNSFINKHFSENSHSIFDNYGGVLLDNNYGFSENEFHVDLKDKTAFKLLKQSQVKNIDIHHVGVVKSYSTSHGKHPLPTETKNYNDCWTDKFTTQKQNQGLVRHGAIDLSLLQYALNILGNVTELAVTALDDMANLPEEIYWPMVNAYELSGKPWRIPIKDSRKLNRDIKGILYKVNPVYIKNSTKNIADFLKLIKTNLQLPITMTVAGITRREVEHYDLETQDTMFLGKSKLVRRPPRGNNRHSWY